MHHQTFNEKINNNMKKIQEWVDEMPIDEARIRFEYKQIETISYYVCKAKIYEVDILKVNDDAKNYKVYSTILKAGAILLHNNAEWKKPYTDKTKK